jgi:hypothetical protein
MEVKKLNNCNHSFFTNRNIIFIQLITNKISLPFRATSVDFTIARGVTGGQVTTVYYTAYGLVGGSGGSFTF